MLLDKKSSIKLSSGQLVSAVAIVDGTGDQVVSFGGTSGSGGSTNVAQRTPTTVSIASTTVSATIFSTNSNRRGLSIANISTSPLNLSFSTPATTANCFIQLPANSFVLLDQQLIVGNAIYGIWTSANGTAQATEYV
jgi:hypothetical protein